MQKLLLALLLATPLTGITQSIHFTTSDTMSGVLYYNRFVLNATQITANQKMVALGFDGGNIVLETNKKKIKRSISFQVIGANNMIPSVFATGEGVKIEKNKREAKIEAEWKYIFEEGKTYEYMITALKDSADKFTIYTAYIHAPENNSWKLLAAIKRLEDGNFLKGYQLDAKLQTDQVNPWIQTDKGRWNELTMAEGFSRNATNTRPQIDWSKNYDSALQAKKDMDMIANAVTKKITDTTGSKEGVFYTITKEGTGKYVKVSDTITVYYKGSLLADGSIFDQTKDKPATFPLNRLIKGWQIAVPMCKVGGSIRVIIPSALAYSIRTRSKNIPPNSVLVFDIDVVDAK
ncbi:MAG: FKBP-type peptidyl-prolyl cis-trans isomerase [Chitinophagaceae bacterium]|nr:FKBP-type peptidyl-prolyl cis-trans isomerase [Chitinophagaceae bacterium]